MAVKNYYLLNATQTVSLDDSYVIAFRYYANNKIQILRWFIGEFKWKVQREIYSIEIARQAWNDFVTKGYVRTELADISGSIPEVPDMELAVRLELPATGPVCRRPSAAAANNQLTDDMNATSSTTNYSSILSEYLVEKIDNDILDNWGKLVKPILDTRHLTK